MPLKNDKKKSPQKWSNNEFVERVNKELDSEEEVIFREWKAEQEQKKNIRKLQKFFPKKNGNTIVSTRVDDGTIRLNKFLANSGLGSRRGVDEYIKRGEVTIDGVVATEMGARIDPTKQEIKYKGKVLKPIEEKYYVLLNKPKDTVTTSDDPQGRKTVMDYTQPLVPEGVRIFPVGRLDRNTTGLLLLTNDGDLAQKLSHPSYRLKKIYHASLDRNLKPADLAKIAAGLELEDGFAMVDQVSYMSGEPATEIGIEIHIGRNRIVRRIFEHLGYDVVKLDRIYYGGLTKKDVKRGHARLLNEREILMLKLFTGNKEDRVDNNGFQRGAFKKQKTGKPD